MEKIYKKPLTRTMVIARLEESGQVEEFKIRYGAPDTYKFTREIVEYFKLNGKKIFVTSEQAHETALWFGLSLRRIFQKGAGGGCYSVNREPKTGTIANALRLQKLAKIAERDAELALGALRFEVSREDQFFIVDGPDGIPIRATKEVWDQWLSTAPGNLRKSLGERKTS